MKKIFLSLVAAIMGTTAMMAQASQMATLNHNDVISVYHGQNAFVEAMAAADNGDVITLNSGTYTATDITKAVTLRGTCLTDGAISEAYVTHIVGNFNLLIPDDVEEKLFVEGIDFSGTIVKQKLVIDGATFQKCKFKEISCKGSQSYESYPWKNWSFRNCYISSKILAPRGSSTTFINCLVLNPENYSVESQVSSMEFDNSIVISNIVGGFYNYSLNEPGVHNSSFTNCIITATNLKKANYILYDTNQAYNCIGYESTGSTSIFANTNKSTNTDLTAEQYNALFKADTFYELTDEAKALYKGNDGTEVGIYGGVLPYTTHVATPLITKCQVAAKTTTDGKLSVDIEVKAAE